MEGGSPVALADGAPKTVRVTISVPSFSILAGRIVATIAAVRGQYAAHTDGK
jgi:hypothetical protein